MSYTIELTIDAVKDIEKFKQSGDKIVLIKIDKLLDELRAHPKTGTGKPEQLKYYEIPTWSRRLTNNHRLIYRIEEDRVVVMVLSFWGHYGDK